jgi:hypothetical protein
MQNEIGFDQIQTGVWYLFLRPSQLELSLQGVGQGGGSQRGGVMCLLGRSLFCVVIVQQVYGLSGGDQGRSMLGLYKSIGGTNPLLSKDVLRVKLIDYR